MSGLLDDSAAAREEAFVREAGVDPAWHLHYLDIALDHAGFLRVSRDVYRNSPFLDNRIQLARTGDTPRVLIAARRLLSAWPDSQPGGSAHYIFHPGHSGSTLVSRTVEALGGNLALREPQPFRTLAAHWREQGNPLAQLARGDYERLEKVLLELLSRTFPGESCAVVKATSECCNLALRVFATRPDARFLWLWTDLETYLATMLRNRARREEVESHAQYRLLDLHRWLDDRALKLFEMDTPQRAAMNWISSMANWIFVGEDDRVMTLRFEAFLNRPAECLMEICEHFALEVESSKCDEVANGELFTHYSKELTSDYGASQRQAQLRRSREENADAIRRGIAFAQSTFRAYPSLRTLEPFLTVESRPD